MMTDEQAHLGLDDLAGLANGAALPATARTHLAGCPQCQAETRGWRMVAAGVRTVMAGAEPPAGLTAAVLTALGSGGAAGTSGRALAPAPPGGRWFRRMRPGWRPATAAAAVVVLGGAGLGVATTLAPGGGTAAGGSHAIPAALTATSCAHLKLVSGRLVSVSGSTLEIKPFLGPAVRVTTSGSTKVAREVSGTLADVHDGLHVIVSGTRAHGQIAARRIGLTPSSLGMQAPLAPAQGPPAALLLGIANGTVADATGGGFTVDEPGGTHVRVTTSSSTRVVMLESVAVSGLRTGQETVAVGSVTGKRELAARTVEQENLPFSPLRPADGYHVLPPPTGFRPVGPGGFSSLPSGFPHPAGLSAVPPRPGALFSGLGCNAPAIAATGLLAFGS